MNDTKRMLTAMVACMAIMMGWYYLTGQNKKQAQRQPQTPPASTFTTPAPTAAPTLSDAPATPMFSGSSWRLKTVEPAFENPVLGSASVKPQGYKAQITLDSASASVSHVLLSEHKFKVTDVETGYPLLAPAEDQNFRSRHSLMFGNLKIVVSGRTSSFDLSGPCWEKTAESDPESSESASISYTATVVNEKDKPMLEVVKTFTYAAQTYELSFKVQLFNRSGAPLTVDSLEMFGPIGPLREDPRSDRRNAAAGYFSADGEIDHVSEALPAIRSDREKGKRKFLKQPSGKSLRWFSVGNKFFAAILRPLPRAGATRLDYISGGSGGRIEALAIGPDLATAALGTSVTLIPPQSLSAGGQFTCNFLMYLGPIDKDIFVQGDYAGLYYEKLLGGRSCICAFDVLTFALLKIMKWVFLVTGNYGIAIILLVLTVRLVLHPIMKKSQVNMMKMQKMQPKMEEIKKKYANNKEEMQRRLQEITKQQAPAMILGCLPMFLQMPIWIALYTAADANVALRHHGLLPASWHWLNDLSAPDRLIPFSWLGIEPIALPMIGTIDAFNLLPLLLCIAMYLQQKLSPQSAMAASNPQGAQQQKMMLIMMPIMMLLFLYSAPSGVNLYIMTSTFGGLIEQKYIRKHLAEQQAKQEAVTVSATSKVSGRFGTKKPKPKPPVRFN